MSSIPQNCQVHLKTRRKKGLPYTTEGQRDTCIVIVKSTGCVAFKQNSLITSLGAQKANEAVTDSLSGEDLFSGHGCCHTSTMGKKSLDKGTNLTRHTFSQPKCFFEAIPPDNIILGIRT